MGFTRFLPRILIAVFLALPAKADRALLLAKGEDIARATCDMIETAQQEVISVEFLVRDDEFGKLKMALLRKKALEGKHVVMQVDALHFLVDPALIRSLMDAGVEVRVYNRFKKGTLFRALKSLKTIAKRDHTKLLVVDGSRLRIGDSNTGDEYVQWGKGHHMRSRDVYIEGAAARGARHYAQQLYESELVSEPNIRVASEAETTAQRGQIAKLIARVTWVLRALRIGLDAPSLLAEPDIRFVTAEEVRKADLLFDQIIKDHEDRRTQRNWGERMVWSQTAIEVERTTFLHDPVGKKGETPGMERAVESFILGTRQSVAIFTPYLLLTPRMKHAVQTVIASGAAVEFATNSRSTSDNITVQSAYQYRIPEYGRLGATHQEFSGNETWHAKLMVKDGEHAMIMSYNIDWVSEKSNMETAVYVKGRAFTQSLNAVLDTDRKDFKTVAERGAMLPGPSAPICRDLFVRPLTSRTLIRAVEKNL